MAIHGTGDCLRPAWDRTSVAYLVEHQTFNPGAWVQLPSKPWSVLKFLANLTNLTHVLSRNSGKTQLSSSGVSKNLC